MGVAATVTYVAPSDYFDNGLREPAVALAAVTIGPLIENGLLAVILWGLSRAGVDSFLAMLLSASALAGLHVLGDWRWAVSIWPLFLVVASTILAYRGSAVGHGLGFLVHALQNAVAVLIAWASSTPT